MRTLLLMALLFAGNILLAQRTPDFIKDQPIPARVVNDYGSFLTSGQKSTLEEKLVAYRQKTGNAIVIITLPTLTDKAGVTHAEDETALQYFNKWGIGEKTKNNGILILVSRTPRRVRIATGTGIDHLLTDADCQRIVDQTIVPHFKAGMFFTGLNEGVNDIETTLSGAGLARGQGNATPSGIASSQTATQTLPQAPATTPAVPTYKRQPMTARQFIGGMLMFALLVWLRIVYVRSRRGAGDTSSSASTLYDTFNAIGWVFLFLVRFLLLPLSILFGLFAMMFGFRRGFGFFGGFGNNIFFNNNRYNSYDSHNSFFSGSSDRFSSSSSDSSNSSSSSDSYGGGSSSGGGAGGSW